MAKTAFGTTPGDVRAKFETRFLSYRSKSSKSRKPGSAVHCSTEGYLCQEAICRRCRCSTELCSIRRNRRKPHLTQFCQRSETEKKTRKRYSRSQSLSAAFGDIEFEVMEVHVMQLAAFGQLTGLAVSPLRVLPFHDSAKPSIWTVDNHRRG